MRTLLRIKKFIIPLRPPVFSLTMNAPRRGGYSPFQILVSVLLSSRTTDAVTDKAAQRLFAKAANPSQLARLNEREISHLIYPVGFYRQKAARICRIARDIRAGRPVPQTFSGLTALPGVGPKTANLVLSLAFGVPTIAVDTHVFRISRRLGWSTGKNPAVVEEQLRGLFPARYWPQVNPVLVGFGQTVCRPLRPKCGDCILRKMCPSAVNRSGTTKPRSIE